MANADPRETSWPDRVGTRLMRAVGAGAPGGDTWHRSAGGVSTAKAFASRHCGGRGLAAFLEPAERVLSPLVGPRQARPPRLAGSRKPRGRRTHRGGPPTRA